MLRLPARFAAVILCFAPLFRQLTWRHAQVLLIGAILVPGQRTVTSILCTAPDCLALPQKAWMRLSLRMQVAAMWSGWLYSPG